MDNKMVEFTSRDLDILKKSLESMEQYQETWRLMSRNDYYELVCKITDLENLIYKIERTTK